MMSEAWLPAFNILPFSTDAIKILEILLRVPGPSPASLLDDLTSRENQLEQTYRLFRVCGQAPLDLYPRADALVEILKTSGRVAAFCQDRRHLLRKR